MQNKYIEFLCLHLVTMVTIFFHPNPFLLTKFRCNLLTLYFSITVIYLLFMLKNNKLYPLFRSLTTC